MAAVEIFDIVIDRRQIVHVGEPVREWTLTLVPVN